MLHNITNRKQGFTLIELAIVLVIAGLLFAGLWRLLSSGNQQVRDQSAASQQTQLISATKSYLASPQGQNWLGNMAPNPSPLLLPLAGTACSTLLTASQQQQFTCFLPAGFINTTVNSYGQSYTIKVLKDTTPAPNPPNTYSFMIVTSGGDTIPDTSGGRVSSAVGNDGGFIYNNNVCNSQTSVATNQSACGAYGAWAMNIATYGFGAQSGGQIASRSYSTPSANTFPWLARSLLPGDNAASPVWNSMQTDLFLGKNSGTNSPNNFWLGTTNNPAGIDGGIINMQAGTINIEGGTISGSGTSNIKLTNATPAPSQVVLLTGGGSTDAVLTASNNCTANGVDSFGNLIPNASSPAGCVYTIETDNLQASGLIYSNAFYAANFNYYSASDIRFKTDIHPLTDTLADVMRLKPVSFTLKSSGQKSMGVIAQDLEKVFPQLVTPGDGMKYVSYQGLIAPLIGAVQELKKENDLLRQELEAQEKRQNELEKKIRLSEPDKHP